MVGRNIGWQQQLGRVVMKWWASKSIKSSAAQLVGGDVPFFLFVLWFAIPDASHCWRVIPTFFPPFPHQRSRAVGNIGPIKLKLRPPRDKKRRSRRNYWTTRERDLLRTRLPSWKDFRAKISGSARLSKLNESNDDDDKGRFFLLGFKWETN